MTTSFSHSNRRPIGRSVYPDRTYVDSRREVEVLRRIL